MEQEAVTFDKTIISAAASISIELPGASIPHFRTYLHALRQWNRVINLTAINEPEEVIIKHFVDSLAGLKQLEVTGTTKILDVGSGAGFPSLPLKIVRPEVEVCLLEPNQKKCAFLRYMIGVLNMGDAQVVSRGIEDYVMQPEVQGMFDYVVVRAYKVTGMGNLLASLLNDRGKLILFRSAKTERDFALSSLALVDEVEYELPSGYGHRVLSIFQKVP